MSAKRHERTRARSCAVQVLYTSEIQGRSASELLAEGSVPSEVGELSAYAVKLIEGVDAHLSIIDGHLASTSENWAVSRMPVLDRSILRLATYEMVYVKDVPVSVAINEAVELAKDFGGKDESPSFVNGVLGRIARGIEAGDIKPVDPAAEQPASERQPEAQSASDQPTEGSELAGEGVSAEPVGEASEAGDDLASGAEAASEENAAAQASSDESVEAAL